jgi:hypothetical protein
LSPTRSVGTFDFETSRVPRSPALSTTARERRWSMIFSEIRLRLCDYAPNTMRRVFAVATTHQVVAIAG